MLSDADLRHFIPLFTEGPWEDRMPGPPIPIDLSLPDQRVNLVGRRGAGKTALLQWLGWKHRDLVASEALILLDNSTPDEAAEIADLYPDSRIFAACGKWVPGFTTREILPLGGSDINTYLHRKVPNPYPGVWKITSHPDLLRLASTPAILAEIGRMAARGLRLPEGRAELYAWIVDNLGAFDDPAVQIYAECARWKPSDKPPEGNERFSLLGAILWLRGGKAAVDGLVESCLDGSVGAIARLYRMETDLIAYGYRIESERHRDQVMGMVRLFVDDPEWNAIPAAVRADAAEALGRLGDPRLRVPTDTEYWVEIAPGLEMGKHLVTVSEYARYQAAAEPMFWADQLDHASRPVTGVSWDEAQAYCRWAGGRLATEAEWQSAAAGRFAWGNEPYDPTRANANELGLAAPTPVGLFPRGNVPGTGVADLSGNVWEWVDSEHQTPDGVRWKIEKGGSCRMGQNSLAVAYRGWNDAKYRHENVGFRCVRERSPS